MLLRAKEPPISPPGSAIAFGFEIFLSLIVTGLHKIPPRNDLDFTTVESFRLISSLLNMPDGRDSSRDLRYGTHEVIIVTH